MASARSSAARITPTCLLSVRVVSEAQYKQWLEQAKKNFASSETPVRYADASAAQ